MTDTNGERRLYSAPALEKGLDIIELLATAPEALSQRELAERLGRSVGEIFRMLSVLEQRGFVEMLPGSERFQLSMRLFRLAHWHLPVNRLTRAAAAPMQRLALGSGQSCHLSALNGGRVLVVARQDSYRDRSFSMRVGAESPLYESCSGQIFHALADDFTRETLRVAAGVTTEIAADAAALAPAIRASGLLEVPSRQIVGIIDMGTPVHDHDGAVAAVLVIPWLNRIDDPAAVPLEAVRAALVATGRAISAALGAEAG